MKHDELVKSVVQWRTALRLPQWEIAQRIDVPRGTYALWEQGRGKLKDSAVARLVKMLNKSRGVSEDPLTISADDLAPLPAKPEPKPEPKAAKKARPKKVEPLRIPIGTPALHRAAMTVLAASPHAKVLMNPKNFLASYAEIANALDGQRGPR